LYFENVLYRLTKCVYKTESYGKQLVPSVRWRSSGTSNLPWDIPRVKRRYVRWIVTLG